MAGEAGLVADDDEEEEDEDAFLLVEEGVDGFFGDDLGVEGFLPAEEGVEGFLGETVVDDFCDEIVDGFLGETGVVEGFLGETGVVDGFLGETGTFSVEEGTPSFTTSAPSISFPGVVNDASAPGLEDSALKPKFKVRSRTGDFVFARSRSSSPESEVEEDKLMGARPHPMRRTFKKSSPVIVIFSSNSV